MIDILYIVLLIVIIQKLLESNKCEECEKCSDDYGYDYDIPLPNKRYGVLADNGVIEVEFENGRYDGYFSNGETWIKIKGDEDFLAFKEWLDSSISLQTLNSYKRDLRFRIKSKTNSGMLLGCFPTHIKGSGFDKYSVLLSYDGYSL